MRENKYLSRNAEWEIFILDGIVLYLFSGTDLQIWRFRAKVFLGAPSPQTKGCGWLIDCSIIVSLLVEYGLMASC